MIFLAMLLTGSSVFAQHAKALAHFKANFPKAEDVFWDEYEEHTEASFTDGEFNKLAHYSSAGVWLETITSISEEDLPESVKKSVLSKTSADNISSINLVEKQNGTTTYEIDVDTDDESYTLIFDKEGKFLNSISNQDEF